MENEKWKMKGFLLFSIFRFPFFIEEVFHSLLLSGTFFRLKINGSFILQWKLRSFIRLLGVSILSSSTSGSLKTPS